MHPELPMSRVGELLMVWPPGYDEGAEDEFWWQENYDDLCEQLTSAMKACDTNYWDWICWVTNFGWRSMDGFMPSFECDNGKGLLQRILPNTECFFKIYSANIGGVKGLAINNSHHDSATGREWYYIMPNIYEETICAKCLTEFHYRTDAPIICEKCGTEARVLYCESCNVDTVFFLLSDEDIWRCTECGFEFPNEELYTQ